MGLGGLLMQRCDWVGGSELEQNYHDHEWGVPVHDERTLFEFLLLEGAQAGLSWSTILRKREHYRLVFDNFDPEKIARYNKKKVERLLKDPGIVRNRLKVAAAVTNAQAYLALLEQDNSLDNFLWSFVEGKPRTNQWRSYRDMPATTQESDAMSRALKKHGFRFVGPTICYAFMQAVGMVNDHTIGCYRHKQLRDS